MPKQSYPVYSIGTVQRPMGSHLQIDPEYRAALKGLADFSHAYVLFWASHYADDDHRATRVVPLPYAEGVESGVFANRSPVRPNPILVSLCAIEDVNETNGTVSVNDIDAFDETPILDIKPYYPGHRPRKKCKDSPLSAGLARMVP